AAGVGGRAPEQPPGPASRPRGDNGGPGPAAAAGRRVVGPRQCLWPVDARDDGAAAATDRRRSNASARLHGANPGAASGGVTPAAAATVHTAPHARPPVGIVPGCAGTDQ